MGRPPNKDRSKVRLKVLPPVRLTQDELDKIKAGASLACAPLTTWAREELLKAAARLAKKKA